MDFVISDLRGFFIHAFKISSPGQFFYFSDDEALGEIDTLCGIWEFIEKIPIEKKIVQLASNECQRRAYRIWRARGYRKKREKTPKGVKMLWKPPCPLATY